MSLEKINEEVNEEASKQAQKTGQPPGTLTYTGRQKTVESHITAFMYSADGFEEASGASLQECLSGKAEAGITWVNVEGLNNVELIGQVCAHYSLHPLTIEDILNVQQRSKVEEFDHYLFITLRVLFWHETTQTFSTQQLSLVVGKDFVVSFHENRSKLFDNIYERLRADSAQRLRQHGSDYLTYRLIDTVVDQYFVVLEKLGDRIEILEDKIIVDPSQENSRLLYKLKRQILLLRKAIWPMREAISHLLQVERELITPFTRLYLRDVYDHTIQAIDTLETFRDMLAGILDVYFAGISNRMNEVMKVLTIIATIFIPITFLTGVFGMNFKYMPALQWHWGFYIALGLMFSIALFMLHFFHRKKWI